MSLLNVSPMSLLQQAAQAHNDTNMESPPLRLPDHPSRNTVNQIMNKICDPISDLADEQGVSTTEL